MALVLTEIDDGVAVLTITSPPVNLGNAALRGELLAAVEGLAGRGDVTGVVLASGLPDFYAGSDITEFDGPIAEPQLPAVVEAIEQLTQPVAAALTGFTLGGGLELALGCDLRIASTTTRLAFPETTLGMLPGAGGTVRTTRLIGVARAIELVGTARQVTADQALELGLVDRVVDPDQLRSTAVTAVREAGKRLLRDAPVPADPDDAIERATSAVLGRARVRPHVQRAVGLILTGAHQSGGEALTAERAAFEELRGSSEAANLRYLFFAKRAAAKGLRTTAEPVRVQRIGIAGAGTMGVTIARACRAAGFAVTLVDTDPGVLARAAVGLGDVASGPPVELSDRLADAADTDLVIDAVFEDMMVKQGLFVALEQCAAPDTIFASNTSYLDLDQVAAVLERPQRLAGLHFFNPADRNPLVEVIRTATGDDRTMATLAALVRRLGKTGIPAGVGEGFVANRVYAEYRTQAEFLLEEGAAPEQIDRAMTDFGFAIGPFAVADMSGLDIAWARRKRLAATRDHRQRYVRIPDLLCEAGRLGKKTGAGYYAYSTAAPRGAVDQITVQIIDAARAEKGLRPRGVSDEQIQQRVLCAMVVGATEVVGSGVAQRASDVDVALTEGFAFPAWHGGPVRYVSSRPAAWVLDGLTQVHASDPVRYAALQVATTGSLPDHISDLLAQVAPGAKIA